MTATATATVKQRERLVMCLLFAALLNLLIGTTMWIWIIARWKSDVPKSAESGGFGA